MVIVSPSSAGLVKFGLQIVGVPSQAQAGAIVIDLAEVGVKDPVFLHHEDDVVHALESAAVRRRGRWRGRWTGASRKSLAAGEEHMKKQSKQHASKDLLKRVIRPHLARN